MGDQNPQPIGTQQLVPDYTGFFDGLLNGRRVWRVYNPGASAIADRTPVHISFVGALGSDVGKKLPRAIALADSATRRWNCVTLQSIAAAGWGFVAIQGFVNNVVVPSATYTDGHAVKIHDGLVTSMGATPAFSDNEFAVIVDTDADGATARTALDLFLYGREALNTT